ncbi:MAG TPA: hypothetical protein VFO83_09755 [Aggregicoccus sp.]|nr:hypothetical protein [Aggregicoccus sp.]
MKRSCWLVVTACALLAGCGSSSSDDDGDAPTSEELPMIAALPGCRAHLTGSLRKASFSVPAPTVNRSGALPLTGAWTEEASTHGFVSTDWVSVPCGGPTASLEFSGLRGVGRLSTRILAELPSSSGGSPEAVYLWPDPPVIDDPSLGPTVPLETSGAHLVTLTPGDGVADICDTKQTVFPVGNVVLPAKAGPPAGGYLQTVADTKYSWSPLDWAYPAAPFELEGAEVALVCDSAWSFGGGYQLTYENVVEGVVKARAQHDFWFEGELALVDDAKVLGYYRLYDIAVTTSGDVTGSYSGPTEVLIPVEGYYEKSVDGAAYVDLPYFEGSGITWQFTLDVLGSRISQQNANILQDHLDRMNLLFPASPSRPGFFRLRATGQEDTQAFSRSEGFVIVNWGLRRREPPKP